MSTSSPRQRRLSSPHVVRRLVLAHGKDFTLLFIECHCLFLRLVKNTLHVGAAGITYSFAGLAAMFVGIERIDFTKKPANGWSKENRRALLSIACRGKTSSGTPCRTPSPRHALHGSELCNQLSPGGQHHHLAYRSRLAAERGAPCRNRRHRRTTRRSPA